MYPRSTRVVQHKNQSVSFTTLIEWRGKAIIISINAKKKKCIWQNQIHFHNENTENSIQGNFLNMIKGSHEKPTANIMYISGQGPAPGGSCLGWMASVREDTWDQPWWGQVCEGERERVTRRVQQSLAESGNPLFFTIVLYPKLVHF